MRPSTPLSFEEVLEDQRSWRSADLISSTVTWPHPHQTFMRVLEDWGSQAHLTSQDSSLGHCQIMLHWLWCSHCRPCAAFKIIVWNSWKLFILSLVIGGIIKWAGRSFQNLGAMTEKFHSNFPSEPRPVYWQHTHTCPACDLEDSCTLEHTLLNPLGNSVYKKYIILH